jgi:hypothetical protein
MGIKTIFFPLTFCKIVEFAEGDWFEYFLPENAQIYPVNPVSKIIYLK